MSDTSPIILGDEERLISELADATLQTFFDENVTQFLSDVGIASTATAPQVQFVSALIGGADRDVGGIASTAQISENTGFQGGIFRALIYKEGEISGIGSTESMFVAGGIRVNPSTRATTNEQSGTETTPSNPNTFISININGIDKKIPAYDVDSYFNTSGGAALNLSSIGQSIIPNANTTYDLGSATNAWRDLYLSGNTINLGGTLIRKNDNGAIEFRDSFNNLTNVVSSSTTDNITEGDTNLYYTTDRVASYLSSNGYDTATNIVASIVDSAPTTLDTLNELAAALGDDANFSSTVATNLGQKLGATASITLSGDITGSASFNSNAVTVTTVDTNLANTNAYIASVASDLNTQEAKQASDLANTNAYIASVSSTERSALANTNAYIASVASDLDTQEAKQESDLANTNAYIASVSSTERSALANTNAYIASVASDLDTQEAKQASDLANTNAYIASVSESQTQYLQVANTATEVESSLSSVGTDIIPSANNTHDLGSETKRWQNIYTNDLHLNNGIGDYTVVEGEEDLFLYNNKTGKVFKFALIEVKPEDATPKIEDLRRK